MFYISFHMDQGSAFGSPGATGDFDVKKFLTKPEVILRLTGWVSECCVVLSQDHDGHVTTVRT